MNQEAQRRFLIQLDILRDNKFLNEGQYRFAKQNLIVTQKVKSAIYQFNTLKSASQDGKTSLEAEVEKRLLKENNQQNAKQNSQQSGKQAKNNKAKPMFNWKFFVNVWGDAKLFGSVIKKSVKRWSQDKPAIFVTGAISLLILSFLLIPVLSYITANKTDEPSFYFVMNPSQSSSYDQLLKTQKDVTALIAKAESQVNSLTGENRDNYMELLRSLNGSLQTLNRVAVLYNESNTAIVLEKLRAEKMESCLKSIKQTNNLNITSVTQQCISLGRAE